MTTIRIVPTAAAPATRAATVTAPGSASTPGKNVAVAVPFALLTLFCANVPTCAPRLSAAENVTFVTIGAGIASLSGDAETKDELISRADKALYTAKRNGRNLACIAPDIEV